MYDPIRGVPSMKPSPWHCSAGGYIAEFHGAELQRNLEQMPGHSPHSIAFHLDDGTLHNDGALLYSNPAMHSFPTPLTPRLMSSPGCTLCRREGLYFPGMSLRRVGRRGLPRELYKSRGRAS